MKKVRLIESEWGGLAHEADGTLLLYRYEVETNEVVDRARLLRLDGGPGVDRRRAIPSVWRGDPILRVVLLLRRRDGYGTTSGSV